jgi:hypothetical protein
MQKSADDGHAETIQNCSGETDADDHPGQVVLAGLRCFLPDIEGGQQLRHFQQTVKNVISKSFDKKYYCTYK